MCEPRLKATGHCIAESGVCAIQAWPNTRWEKVWEFDIGEDKNTAGILQECCPSKNRTTEEMRKKIMCSFYHASSTDASPQHHLCPSGTLSLCFYNRAIATGKPTPRHEGKSACFLSPQVAQHVKKISDDTLLQRCMAGMTQNANESFHATIWQRCPNHIFVGTKRVSIAAAIAVGNFNIELVLLYSYFRARKCQLQVSQALGRKPLSEL